MSDVTRPIPGPAEQPPAEQPLAADPTVVDHTAPIVVPPARARRQQVLLAFIAVAAAAFLIGLLVGTTTRPADDPADAVTADVGRAGRTIRFDGGLLVIPRNALDHRVRLTIDVQPLSERLRIEDTGDEGTTIVIEPGELRAYRFGPADLTFRKPVEITFRLPRDARRATLFAREGDRTTLLRGTIDYIRGTATMRVRDFRFQP